MFWLEKKTKTKRTRLQFTGPFPFLAVPHVWGRQLSYRFNDVCLVDELELVISLSYLL